MVDLYLFLEGEYDKHFFEKIISHLFIKSGYNDVKFILYAKKPAKYCKNYKKSINSMQDDFLIITDFDNGPCKTAKKEKIIKKFGKVPEEKIFVVILEIEGWYLSGLSENDARKLKLRKRISNTNNISKEQFINLKPTSIDSKIEFYQEVLNNFSLKNGIAKNKSLKYFIQKNNLNVAN